MNEGLNSRSVDVVGVFDSKFNQVFPAARPIKAQVKEVAKLMEHPVESGSTITDHRVILPTEIELTLMLQGDEYRDTYGLIRGYFMKTELLTVQTNTGSYTNMVIEAMPHDETPETFDAAPMALKLKEVLLVTAQFQALPPAAVKNTRDASKVKRGEQTGKTETATESGGKKKSSVLYGILYGK